MLLSTMMALAASAETPPQTAPVPPVEEKKVCRRDIETGSLIKGKKICMTVKQWNKVADANRQEVERTVSSGSQSN